jgi:hypothetical protein
VTEVSKHCEKLVNNCLTPSVAKTPVGGSLEKELNYLASRGLVPRLINGPAWYTWDVVASALNLKARTAAEVLEIVPEAHLQYLFGPMDWKEHTLPALRRTKANKRATL